MELLHLRYFKTVAETENISQAARQLYVSQPALSTAIKRLEKELGFPLFERKGNRIVLTEAGQCFHKYVNSLFSTLAEGVDKARQITNRDRERVRVVSGFGVIRGIAEDYVRDHPGSLIEASCCDTEQIYAELAAGEADMGLNMGSIADKRFTCRTLMTGRYYVAVNDEHPFHSKKSIRLRDLDGQLLFCSNLAGTYERGMRIFQKAGISCNLLTLDERNVLFSAAAKGLGGVFCMPMFIEKRRSTHQVESVWHKVVLIPIQDCEDTGEVTMITRKDEFYSAQAQHFMDYVEHRFRKNQEALQADLADRGLSAGGADGPDGGGVRI